MHVRSLSDVIRYASLGLLLPLASGYAEQIPFLQATPALVGNGKIAFYSHRDNDYEIYVMEADGSKQTRLTITPGNDSVPAWSPDGTKIAFSSFRDGNIEIYVMDANGSNPVRLTFNGAEDSNVKWSPDGAKLAFTSNRDGNYEIYVMDANGANQTRLTTDPGSDYSPAWSPDGTKIAFNSNRDGNYEIYVMDANGANPIRLTNNTGDDYRPAWSPNGAKIAFSSYRDGNYEIYVMDANGANQTNLTNNLSLDYNPAWSPDGSKIAFETNRDGNDEIYVMDANGSNPTNLTNNPGQDLHPDWQPISIPLAGHPGNISTRLSVGTNDNVLIGGFIVTGSQPKRVIVRAIGPSLTGIPGALANPTLELYGPSGLISSNDNWMDAPNRQEIINSTLAPTSEFESAILMTLPANNSAYTAIERGVNNGTGVGLVEVYDLDSAVDSKLANISTRGFVQTGDDVMIGGLIVVGQSPTKVIVRAIGPSLSIPSKLADPTLELHDGNGTLLQSNDNWRTGGQEADIIATTIPPSNDLESAIVRSLNPGNYTAIVRGLGDGTGIGLIEVYDLGAP